MYAAVLLGIAVVFFFLACRFYAWFIAQASGKNDTTRCDADAFADTEKKRLMRALPLLDRAETGVAQPGVKQADDSRRLIGVSAIRVTGVADRGRVLESDGMMQKEADSHPGVQTIDEFRSMIFMPSDIRYII